MARALDARRLLVRNLFFFWRTNAAIVLGVVVGTAVIGGALIVGDSVRFSLRQMTLDRLGQIDCAVTGFRFFREDLAEELLQASGLPEGRRPRVAPAIVMVGGVERRTAATTRRAGQVNIYGVDRRAWELIAPADSAPPESGAAILNASLAAALEARVGDEITLWIELPSAVPRDTLLGKRDNDAQEVAVKVARVLDDGPGAPRLGLQPTQHLPLNVFVDLAQLQEALDIEKIRPTKKQPTGAPARVNTLFSTSWPAAGTERDAAAATAALRKTWTLADLHLRLVHDRTLNVLSLESEQMLLEDRFAQLALQYAHERRLPSSPVLVYLANWFRNPRDPQAYAMYSTVAGLDVLDLDDAFGPFEFLGGMPDSLADSDVILNEFLATDLKVQVGDSVRMGYHLVGSHGELPEEERTLTVRGIVQMAGAAIDRQLTPEVKGITDADSLNDWDQPFPMKLDDVTPRDDEYWDSYRATPKAFFRLDTAQRLWPSRYGRFTSVRIALGPGQSVDDAEREFTEWLLAHADPAPLGLAFQPLKADGLRAASGATDFTVLFIAFSMFLIAAAMMLVGLLFRLAIEQRVRQWGLLAAVGLAPRQVRWLLFGEGLILVLLGGVAGAGAAIGYAELMLYGLRTWWIGAVGTKFLVLSIDPLSVMAGAAGATAAALAAVWWGLRQLQGISIREELAGVADRTALDDGRPGGGRGTRRKAYVAAAVAAGLIAGVVVGLIPSTEAFSGLAWPVVVFFVAGTLLLAAGLWGLSGWLQSDQTLAVSGRGAPAVMRLGLRNAARRRQRSVFTTGLIASACFVIAAVAAGHKNPAVERPDRHSGNGGFTLVAESSSPILYDLNTADGRAKLGISSDAPARAALLSSLKVVQFRVKPGEDASCLNLFQSRVPTILGVPRSLIERGGFKFQNASGNPWLKLLEQPPDGSIPVLGDFNTLTFGLKKGVGQTLALPSEVNPQHRLRVAGMLDGSVFQGVLLMSEENCLRLFPERKGFQYFLVEVPPEQAEAATDLLETELAEYGFDAEPVAQRLARFLAVQNTYLSTFQSLGGLGLLLGTFGLATVMLRNVLERQAELALLRAIGFRPGQIAGLVLTETALLLAWGLATGAGSALLAMTPHLLSTGADVPWGSGAALLAGVAAAGLGAAWWAVRAAMNVPIVATLRGE